jgi:hypothetical protein
LPVALEVEVNVTGHRDSGALGVTVNDALTAAGAAPADGTMSTTAKAAAITEAAAAGNARRERARFMQRS